MRAEIFVGLVLLSGCDPIAPPTTPCLHWEAAGRVRFGDETRVDLLFVVDSSHLGAAARDALPAQAARIVRVLGTGDLDGDGTPEFDASGMSLRAGVITTDLGSPACASGSGDDAVLRSASACGAHPPVIALDRGGDVERAASEVACAVQVGTTGCESEQPLEAALKALSPALATTWTAADYTPPTFADGNGHALGANAGLVRDRSALVIVLITDEDDCSVADGELLDPESARYGDVPMPLRCVLGPDALHPVERYVRGLMSLRTTDSPLVFVALVGAPPDVEPASRAAEYDALLVHPAMQVEVDRATEQLRPSCTAPDAVAQPPRRIVETARALDRAGAHTRVVSLCGDDESDAVIEPIVSSIAGFAPCLPRDFARPEECVLQELLPAGSPLRCDELAGRRHAGWLGTGDVRRERCQVDHVASGALGAGWTLERARELPADSLVARRCGEDGIWLRAVGALQAPESELRLACPERLGPDGGTCD